MYQINFRVDESEKEIIEIISQIKGWSMAEYSKRSVLKEIENERIDIAFGLLNDGKIGRKRALKLSGLSYREFMMEGAKRGVSEKIPDEIREKELASIKNHDIKKFLLHDLDSIKKPLI